MSGSQGCFTEKLCENARMDDVLTIEESARHLRVSTKHVRALIKRGRISPSRVGLGTRRERLRIRRSQLERFLALGAEGLAIHPEPLIEAPAAKVPRTLRNQIVPRLTAHL